MTRLRHLGQAHRALLMLVLAAILFARVVVPQGWMPSAKGQWITICSGMGIETAWIDSDGKIHKDDAPKAPEGKCAFAAAAALHTPDMSTALAPITGALARLAATYVQVGQGLAAPPPPATGPPALI